MRATVAGTFTRYERTLVQVKHVTTVTEENIHHIAALAGGSVDYSGDMPVLVLQLDSGPWRIPVGQQVGFHGEGGDRVRLMNESGFNSSGEWKEARP